jgi:hypothetical protein
MGFVKLAGWIAFSVAVLIACVNFYLSFLRYPLNRLFRRPYKWVSGIPVIGTLCLILSSALLLGSLPPRWAIIVVILADTGGLPWFAVIMLWAIFFRRKKSN